MVLYISLLLLAAIVGGALGAPKVTGGVEVNIEDYPYQVSIEYEGEHSCGGSIISSTRILTAAHCTFLHELDKLRIRAGSSLREQGGQVITIKRYYVHPEYNYTILRNDIAVLILSSPLTIGVGVQPIPLIAEDGADVPIGTIANLAGWGLSETGTYAHHLRKTEVTRLSYADCPGLPDPSTTTCYGGGTGTACHRDSGGAIVISGIQVGIASAGYPICHSRYPAAYVIISMFRNFIDNETPDV